MSGTPSWLHSYRGGPLDGETRDVPHASEVVEWACPIPTADGLVVRTSRYRLLGIDPIGDGGRASYEFDGQLDVFAALDRAAV